MATHDSTSTHPFLDARVAATRLVSENVTSNDGAPGLVIQNLQLQIVTESGFGVALDAPEAPSAFFLTIDFVVRLLQSESQQIVTEYRARHAAQCIIHRSGGIANWGAPPAQVLAPYMSFVHRLAVMRAEETISATGIKGIRLPAPDDFSGNTPTDSQS